jgi:hypothetical protein
VEVRAGGVVRIRLQLLPTTGCMRSRADERGRTVVSRVVAAHRPQPQGALQTELRLRGRDLAFEAAARSALALTAAW